MHGVGVQSRAGNETFILCAVEPVSGQRMPYGGHMQPQLMGATGVWDKPQQG